MTDRETARPVVIEEIAVDRARRGEWPGLRTILNDAIKKIPRGQPLQEGRSTFLAEALEIVAEASGHDEFEHAATLLRRQEPLPPDVAAPVMTLVKSVSRQMCVALAKLKRQVEDRPEDPDKLFAPNPPAHRYLDLETHTIEAFRLKNTGPRGGRPRHARQLDQLFVVYDELRGYGANRTQAQEILAHRFNVTLRTIQRKLERRPLTTLEPHNGELVLRQHGSGKSRPENPLEDRPPAFEPYLKSRLATAVWSPRNKGVSLERACEEVADAFGLNFDRGEERVDFGTEIVGSAARECGANQSGWARVPLAVCRHEIGRRLRVWPSPEEVAEVRGLAAAWGESPATVDAVSRDIGADMPTCRAVKAVAEELGLDFDIVMELCRLRYQLRADRSGD